MSLLSSRPKVDLRGAADFALFRQMECRACPLDKLNHKLPATGHDNPLVYVLGHIPSVGDVDLEEHFSGQGGKLFLAHVPRQFKSELRFNNIIRSRPDKGETTPRITECCRPSVVRDIEESKPEVIVGFGNAPLEWISGYTGISSWRGRRMPVKVGSHTCWYYPMLDPDLVVKGRRKGPSAEEHIFGMDIRRIFDDLGQLPEAVVHTPKDVMANCEMITGDGGLIDVARVREALKWGASLDLVGYDYETNGIRPYNNGKKLLSTAIGTAERAVSIALNHPEAGWNPEQLITVQELWAEFLRSKALKVAHNLAFELEWGHVHCSKDLLRGNWGDTMTQAATIDERTGQKRGGAGPLSLEFLVQQYYGFNLKKLFGVDRANLEGTPLETVLAYNAPDARYAAMLFAEQALIIEERGLEEAYSLALRSIPAAVAMQVRGLPLNAKENARLSKKYNDAYDRIEGELFALEPVKEFRRRKGKDFKPLSNPDVLFVLKDILKRKEVEVEDKYTKKIKYSADEAVLSQIKLPIAAKLVELRKVNKQLSTYITPLTAHVPGTLVYDDGLLHAQFNTVFAESGRFSCDSPNLQNFPKRGAVSKEVRKQIIAAPGCHILAADYGQIEARVIACATQDERFSKSLWERYDIHFEWAERLARAYPSRVGGKKNFSDKKIMKDFRTDVKNQWTFPLFFGAKLESAAGYLNIPPHIIKPLYDQFWVEFSGVKTWQKTQLEFYKQNGYVECLTGKRRYGPLTVNQIFNSPIQGTAAAIVNDVLSRLFETGNPELQPEIQIHDDLTFVRIPTDRIEPIAEEIIDIMLKPVFPWFNVPLTVEAAIGPDWLNMSEFGTFSSDQWFA